MFVVEKFPQNIILANIWWINKNNSGYLFHQNYVNDYYNLLFWTDVSSVFLQNLITLL